MLFSEGRKSSRECGILWKDAWTRNKRRRKKGKKDKKKRLSDGGKVTIRKKKFGKF